MRYSISPRRQKRSKGAVFIEAGLVFVAFAFMLMGVFDFAQFLFVHQALVDRARSAARWGAVTDPKNSTAIQNMVLYNQSATPPAGTPGLFGMTPSMVSVSELDTTTGDRRLVVALSNYQYEMISPLIGGLHYGPNIVITIPLGFPTS